MDREQFILATAVTLFAAFVMGWFASWLVHRLTRASRADLAELDRMAQQLHEAEEAIAMLRAREAELTGRLAGTDGELRAALDALNESRTEVEELRDYIEKKLARTRSGA